MFLEHILRIRETHLHQEYFKIIDKS